MEKQTTPAASATGVEFYYFIHEPMTFGLIRRVIDSTFNTKKRAETRSMTANWLRGTDLNRRPSGYEVESSRS